MIRTLCLVLLLFAALPARAEGLRLEGGFVQGGLVVGTAAPGARVEVDGRPVRVSAQGRFVFGFGRDVEGPARLRVVWPDGRVQTMKRAVEPRQYLEQHIEGLPSRMVTPPQKVLERIRRENALIAEVRARDSATPRFESGWVWPLVGTITGVYGSRRILNGEPRRPHFGIDIAGAEGAPVVAPADGEVAMAEPDLYFTGGTVMLDHGHGLTSVFSHLSALDVTVGQQVHQGEPIGKVGSTGRSTGPHLDWRVNWFAERLDPALLAGPMPKP